MKWKAWEGIALLALAILFVLRFKVFIGCAVVIVLGVTLHGYKLLKK